MNAVLYYLSIEVSTIATSTGARTKAADDKKVNVSERLMIGTEVSFFGEPSPVLGAGTIVRGGIMRL